MPTGYTAQLRDDTTFGEFALICARAFGALVTMRESPHDAEIPEAFEPAPYYREIVAQREAELARLRALSPEEAAAEAAADHAAEVDRVKQVNAERDATERRYRSMLASVNAWTPPTPEHEHMKEFMREQLETSLEFDCHPTAPAPPRLSGEEWRASQIATAERLLEYAQQSLREETDRCRKRTEWIKALRESVKGN